MIRIELFSSLRPVLDVQAYIYNSRFSKPESLSAVESQLHALLAELLGKCLIDFKHLELEQLQLLVCKQLGLLTVRASTIFTCSSVFASTSFVTLTVTSHFGSFVPVVCIVYCICIVKAAVLLLLTVKPRDVHEGEFTCMSSHYLKH